MVKCSSKNGYEEDMCFKEIGLQSQNMIMILYMLDNNMIGRDLYDQFFCGHKNLHFDNKLHIHNMSSKNHDKSGHDLDLDLATSSYEWHGSCPRRSRRKQPSQTRLPQLKCMVVQIQQHLPLVNGHPREVVGSHGVQPRCQSQWGSLLGVL